MFVYSKNIFEWSILKAKSKHNSWYVDWDLLNYLYKTIKICIGRNKMKIEWDCFIFVTLLYIFLYIYK